MTTCREKPKPVDAAEDVYQTILGTTLWVPGISWVACQVCGCQITSPVRRLEAPKEKDT